MTGISKLSWFFGVLFPVLAVPFAGNAHGLHPEQMMPCVQEELERVLDGLEVVPLAKDLPRQQLVVAYAESFSNCHKDVEQLHVCLSHEDPKSCLESATEAARGAIDLEKLAAMMLAEQDGKDPSAQLDATDLAVARYDAGLGEKSLSGCLRSRLGELSPEANTFYCRLMYELNRYAAFLGAYRLFASLETPSDREISLATTALVSIDEVCLAQAVQAMKVSMKTPQENPASALLVASIPLRDCAGVKAAYETCRGTADQLEECLVTAWRRIMAVRIAHEELIASVIPKGSDPSVAVSTFQAVAPQLIATCLDAMTAKKLPAAIGWALCSIENDLGRIAVAQGYELYVHGENK